MTWPRSDHGFTESKKGHITMVYERVKLGVMMRFFQCARMGLTLCQSGEDHKLFIYLFFW